METTCPWGNRMRMHGPEPEKFGPLRLGMPYVEFDVPAGTRLDKIAQFYTEILGGIAGVANDEKGPYAWASTSADSKVIYRESDRSTPNMTATIFRSRLRTFRARTRSWWSAD